MINHKQLSKNLISNVLLFAFNTLINIWLTPYLIKNLGIGVYGLIPLSTSIKSYISLLTLSFNSSVGRYLTIAIHKEDEKEARTVFNTAIAGGLGLNLISIPFMVGILFLLPKVINFPVGYENQSMFFFIMVFLVLGISVIQSSFSISSWALNRFDLRNLVIALSNVVRIVAIILFFTNSQPDIYQVGIALLLSTISNFIGDLFLWKKLTPQLIVQLKDFSSGLLRQIMQTSGWMVVNHVGSLLFLNTDLIVINTLLGVEKGGEYGAIIIFSALIRNLAATISGILTPLIISMYATDKMKDMHDTTLRAVRLLGIFVGLGVGILCGFSRPFLTLWLGPEYSQSWVLLCLTIIHLPINLAVLPLFGVQTAMNKVKIPGIVTLLMGIVNIVLAIIFIMVLDLGVIGVALSSALVLTAKNVFFTTIYVSKIQKISWLSYLKGTLPGLLVTMIVGGLSFLSANVFTFGGWGSFMLIAIGVAICSMLLIFFFILKEEDKKLLLNAAPEFGGANAS